MGQNHSKASGELVNIFKGVFLLTGFMTAQSRLTARTVPRASRRRKGNSTALITGIFHALLIIISTFLSDNQYGSFETLSTVVSINSHSTRSLLKSYGSLDNIHVHEKGSSVPNPKRNRQYRILDTTQSSDSDEVIDGELNEQTKFVQKMKNVHIVKDKERTVSDVGNILCVCVCVCVCVASQN